MLYQIKSSYFVAGIVVEGETVVEAAPIIHYMLGWDVARLYRMVMRKGWKVTQCS